MRKAAQITGAALIAAVLMTGCSSGSKKDDSSSKPTDSASAGSGDQQQTSNPPAQSGDKAITAAQLAGSWMKGKPGSPDFLMLAIIQQHASVIDHNTCDGQVIDNAQPVTLTFTCKDGDKKHAKGTVKSVDGSSLTVAWESGETDTLTKAKVPTMPMKPGA